MIRLDVLTHLERMGKTRYWLNKQLGMSYQNFTKMINNQTLSIKYSTLETLCQIFNCTPNDLLIFDPDTPDEP